MSDIKITLTTDNAAFDGDCAGEVARILRELAERIESQGLMGGEEHGLRDINGNTVGRFINSN